MTFFRSTICDVEMGATYVYTGKLRTAASSSSPNDILDPFELLNLNLSWTNIFGAPVDLTAFATNVLQEKYATYASGTYNTTGVDSRRSEEQTSELQSLMRNSYAVFCLKKKKTKHTMKTQQ